MAGDVERIVERGARIAAADFRTSTLGDQAAQAVMPRNLVRSHPRGALGRVHGIGEDVHAASIRIVGALSAHLATVH